MEGNDEATTFDIQAAIAESNPELNQESTEQQEESTEVTTDTVDLTEEANTSTEEEISETEAATEEETNSEETNEEDSTDSDIVDLNDDNNTEETSNVEEESSQTTQDYFSEMLDGQFEDEKDLESHLIEQQSIIEKLEAKEPEFANEYVKKMNDHGGSNTTFNRIRKSASRETFS